MKIIHKGWRFFKKTIERVQNKLKVLDFKLTGAIQLESGANVHYKATFDPGPLKDKIAISIGRKTKIKQYAYLGARGGFIKIGKNCSVNPYCVLLGYGGITIGNNVRIAAGCSIIAFNHNFLEKDKSIIEQGNNWEGVVIQDDVWLGTGVRVLDGVTIGKGAVVGAGSVVTKSIPEFAVAVGTPAKVIKYRV